MQAIALSLGQDIDSQPASDTKEQDAAKKKEEAEEKARKQQQEEKEKVKSSMEPIDKVLLNEFSDLLLPGCIKLASVVSESVYRVCDLVSALARRNGDDWRNWALQEVCTAVSCV